MVHIIWSILNGPYYTDHIIKTISGGNLFLLKNNLFLIHKIKILIIDFQNFGIFGFLATACWNTNIGKK